MPRGTCASCISIQSDENSSAPFSTVLASRGNRERLGIS